MTPEFKNQVEHARRVMFNLKNCGTQYSAQTLHTAKTILTRADSLARLTQKKPTLEVMLAALTFAQARLNAKYPGEELPSMLRRQAE